MFQVLQRAYIWDQIWNVAIGLEWDYTVKWTSAGVSKLRPKDQIQPVKPFYLACEDILSVMKK